MLISNEPQAPVTPENQTGVDTQPKHPKPRRWLREPLLHFVLIGAVLFAFSLWHGRDTIDADAKTIVITDDDVLQILVIQRSQGLSEPTPEQFQRLLDARIREEVLYREALAMGLDQNDTIVKRRMAQKMDFLAEDLSTLREPSSEELQTWLQDHPQDFTYPPRATFRHLFFSFDKHRQRTHEAATAALAKVAGLGADSPEAMALGERSMLSDHYSGRTPDQVVKDFGMDFAQALFKEKPGAWTGPIKSGYGWHLLFIESLTPARLPEFEEVSSQVKKQWEANQRAEFKAEAYRVMREKYQVQLPPSDVKEGGNHEG